jgi:hypothetical protein
MISVGKERAGYLVQLYDAIVRPVRLELPPDFEIRADSSQFQFS